MHYLIDGYNLIFAFSNKSTDLEDNRRDLLNILKKAFVDSKQDITIIFDGKGPDINYDTFNPIQVIFTSKKISADDYILEIVSISLTPSQITVVSSDKKLTKRCRYFGSKTMNNESFLKWLKNKHLKKTASDKNISFQDSKENIDRLQKIFEKKLKEL